MVSLNIDKLIEEGASFKEILDDTLKVAAESMEREGKIEPSLIVVTDDGGYGYPIPDGRTEMASFFVDKVTEHKGSKGYIFLTEAWSITIPSDNLKEIEHYKFNPEEIANNPFKTERISFQAGAKGGEAYSGHISVERDEKGSVKVGAITFDDDHKYTEASVADLLTPMVE